MDYSNILNINQSVWIEASAGTGKTTMLTKRVIELLNNNIDPQKIVCLTFTRNAANQMVERIHAVHPNVDIIVTTIHAFAFSLIKQYYEKLLLNQNIKIIDQNTHNELIAFCKQKFAEKYQDQLISIALSDYQLVRHIEYALHNSDQEHEPMLEYIASVYHHTMHSWGIISFDQCIEFANKLIQDDEVCYGIDCSIEHILIDEAQDINNAQWSIIESIITNFSDTRKTCFIVGDVKQSIYSFQGVQDGYMQDIKARIQQSIQERGGAFYVCNIPSSYRSPISLINVVNNIFHDKHKWQLQKTENKNLGNLFLHPLYKKKDDMIEHIISIIQSYESKDIMVLFRTRNVIYKALCTALNNHGILYVSDEKIQFDQTLLFNDLMSFARFACEPFNLMYATSSLRALGMIDTIDNNLNEIINNSTELQYIQSISRDNAKNFYVQLLQRFWYRLVADNQKRANAISKFLDNIDQYQSLQSYIISEPCLVISDNLQNPNAIKILTVHGAKGLQSEIVIAPQTVETNATISKLNIPEYNRLLYVLLTRTQDQMHVLGCGRSPSQASWFTQIANAVEFYSNRI